jgi:hypothetical protein
MEERSRRRSAGDRDPLAPRGIPSLLAIHLGTWTGAPRANPDPKSQQRWVTFLRNHRDLIAGMDFLVVPTVRFQLFYAWFAIDHGRRRILHCNVTAYCAETRAPRNRSESSS